MNPAGPTPANAASLERIRTRIKLIEEKVARQSQEEKLNQVRLVLREEATQILLPALQDAMAQMTLQLMPDPKIARAMENANTQMGRLADNVSQLAEAQKQAEQTAKDTTERIAVAMDQMVTETVQAVTVSNTRTAEDLLREQKTMARKQRFWTLATMGLVTLLMITATLGIVGYLRWEERAKLGSEIAQLREERAKELREMQRARDESQEAKVQKEAQLAEVEKLRAEETATRLQIKQSADTVTAVNQARAQAQADIRKLQEIQEKNRFKLLQGQEGSIFVEVPLNSKPFAYQGKTYVKVQD
jgi:hypothetical protein